MLLLQPTGGSEVWASVLSDGGGTCAGHVWGPERRSLEGANAPAAPSCLFSKDNTKEVMGKGGMESKLGC